MFVKRIFKWFGKLIAEGLLYDFIIGGSGLKIGVGVVVTALITWFGASVLPTTPLLVYLLTVIGILVFCYIVIAVDLILGWSGRSSRGIKIKFCKSNGLFIHKIPTAEFTKEGNNIVYSVDGYVRLANLGFRTRTIEAVRMELRAKRELLDERLLGQFPIGKRMESLDTLPTAISIATKLKVNDYKLNQILHDHSKATVTLIFEATGDVFKARTKVMFKNKPFDSNSE